MKYECRHIPAVILAGGPAVAFESDRRAQKKALMRFDGKPSIEYVMDALRNVPQIERIAITGISRQDLNEAMGIRGIEVIPPAQGSMVDHVYAALRHFRDDPGVFFVTADAPLVSSASVVDFLTRVSETESNDQHNIFFPFVPSDCFKGNYRHVPKPFLRFKNTSVSHGNLAVLDSRIGLEPQLKRKLDRLYKHRKNAAMSLISISPAAALEFSLHVLLGRPMEMQSLARRISKSLNVRLHPVIVPHPEITVDADEPEDYHFIKNFLENRLHADPVNR